MITRNESLKQYNTFGIEVFADFYSAPGNLVELLDIIDFSTENHLPHMTIGEGSNLLFLGDYRGLIVHPQFNFREVIEEDSKHVYLHCGAGVNWDELVEWTVQNNWQGFENLSLIPGNVGATPVQNIGAYGVEICDLIVQVNYLRWDDAVMFELTPEQCLFGYRNSIFKNQMKDQGIVTSVVYKLNKKPQFTLNYGNLKEKIENNSTVNLENIRNTIIKIRQEKLPDPIQLGNAGSFFTNPVISQEKYFDLTAKFPDIPEYPTGEEYKIPAAWLIEKAGLKGARNGSCGTHPSQPLVIVNYGEATGEEIADFALMISNKVNELFGITLKPEVNYI